MDTRTLAERRILHLLTVTNTVVEAGEAVWLRLRLINTRWRPRQRPHTDGALTGLPTDPLDNMRSHEVRPRPRPRPDLPLEPASGQLPLRGRYTYRLWPCLTEGISMDCKREHSADKSGIYLITAQNVVAPRRVDSITSTSRPSEQLSSLTQSDDLRMIRRSRIAFQSGETASPLRPLLPSPPPSSSLLRYILYIRWTPMSSV
jgi:hypothetical protein